MSIRIENDLPIEYYEAIGYRPFGKIAIRVDIVERVASMAWKLSQLGAFSPPTDLMNLIGGSAEDATEVLKRLGYRQQTNRDKIQFRRHRRSSGNSKRPSRYRKIKMNPDSPFAKLATLKAIIE